MATRLKNIVRFTDVPASPAPGSTVSLPHGLAVSPPGGSDIPQTPDRLGVNAEGFEVTADATNVTVTNLNPVATSVDVLAEYWHTIERAFGNAATLNLVPKPFVEGSASAGGSSGLSLEILPECWQQQDVPAAQIVAAMAAGVSQIFDDYQAIRAGSIAGINLRFNAVLGAGSATAVVTVNGVATALSVTVSDPDASGRATVDAGVISYAAGDRIGVTLETDAGFLPDGSLDVEASVEVHV